MRRSVLRSLCARASFLDGCAFFSDGLLRVCLDVRLSCRCVALLMTEVKRCLSDLEVDERTEAVYKERFMRDRRTSADGAFDGLVSNLRLYGKNEVPPKQNVGLFLKVF